MSMIPAVTPLPQRAIPTNPRRDWRIWPLFTGGGSFRTARRGRAVGGTHFAAIAAPRFRHVEREVRALEQGLGGVRVAQFSDADTHAQARLVREMGAALLVVALSQSFQYRVRIGEG